MAFRIQDLMTDVLPQPVRWASCPGGTTCRGGDGFAAVSGKGGKSPHCPPVSRGNDSPRTRPRPAGAPPEYGDLALLKGQLRQAMARAQG